MLTSDRHSHAHVHEPSSHTHRHRHDDGPQENAHATDPSRTDSPTTGIGTVLARERPAGRASQAYDSTSILEDADEEGGPAARPVEWHADCI